MSKKEEFPRRQHLSIGKEFKEVAEILDRLPAGSMSRFICEAILHYDKVKNNPDWYFDRIAEMKQYMMMAKPYNQFVPEEEVEEKHISYSSPPVENQFDTTRPTEKIDTVTTKKPFDSNINKVDEVEINTEETRPVKESVVKNGEKPTEVTKTETAGTKNDIQHTSDNRTKRNIPPFMRR